jgi:hypothetical protein
VIGGTAVTNPVDDRLGALLAADKAAGASHVAGHIADSYLSLATAFGFEKAAAGGPGPNRAASSQDALAAALHGLADLATASRDLSSLQDLLVATLAPGEARNAAEDLHFNEPAPDADTLFAFYDLKAGPLTYDFIQFLVLAEKFRNVGGKRHLHVLIVPGDHGGFRSFSQRDRSMSDKHKEWRLRQLVMQSCFLAPGCAGVTRFRSRSAAKAFRAQLAPTAVFPPAFDLEHPFCPYLLGYVLQHVAQGPDIRALRAPPVASALVRRLYRDLAGDRPVVTITLRQSDFQPQRNSRADQWLALAASCRRQGLFPVVIPDTEAVLNGAAGGLGDLPVCALAALSIGFRAAAYQESWLNMLANSGPYTLCLYNAAARFSMFKLMVPGVHTASAMYHVGQGLMPGSQLPFAGKLQRLVWDDDSFEALDRELSDVIALAVASGLAPDPAGAAERSIVSESFPISLQG